MFTQFGPGCTLLFIVDCPTATVDHTVLMLEDVIQTLWRLNVFLRLWCPSEILIYSTRSSYQSKHLLLLIYISSTIIDE